jgi:hypothetical protein
MFENHSNQFKYSAAQRITSEQRKTVSFCFRHTKLLLSNKFVSCVYKRVNKSRCRCGEVGSDAEQRAMRFVVSHMRATSQ